MKNHPDVHEPWQTWSEDATLHVACAYSNPLRWRTRRVLMNDFRRHMQASPNVALHVGELAYGERPFEVTGDDPNDIQLRTTHELWHKENILNLVVQRFPAGWKYGAVIDADFHMTRRDWALESIHQLQHFDFVQLFSSYADLSAEHRPYRLMSSFAANYVNRGVVRESSAVTGRGASAGYGYGSHNYRSPGGYRSPVGFRSPGGFRPPGGYGSAGGPGATGGAWAFRKSAFDTVGGLLDVCVLGSADWHMAFGLVGEATTAPELTHCTAPYIAAVRRWQDRAEALKQNIGYVDNHAIHHFHGSKVFRGYGDRWKILRDHNFNPETDLARDWHGVWQLRDNKPRLRDAIRGYFRSRNEDDRNLSGSEREMA